MIIRWMLELVAMTALFSVAALAAERLLRLWRKQARGVWAAAMGLSLLLPLITLAQSAGYLPSFPTAPPLPQFGPAGIHVLPRVVIGATTSHIDLVIALLWAAASVAITTRFVLAARALGRRRAAWRAAEVDGQPLLVSEDAGPAVVGFRRPAVVIPDWVLGLEQPLRQLVLRHEREHLEHNDPRLIVAALGAATIAPWNPVLWFQLRRLRAALELDCDLRVLRAHPDARRYGTLLLAVAQRTDRTELLAAALTEATSLLGRRIAAMRRPLDSFRVTQTALLAAAVALAAIAACETQSPADPALRVSRAASTAKPIYNPPGTTYFEYQVEQPVSPAPGSTQARYPDVLREARVEGEVLAQFVVNPDGLADVATFKVLKSTHDLFTQAVRNALPQMRFKPALVGGRPVRQLVQAPFSVALTK
jgi:TonB family protein